MDSVAYTLEDQALMSDAVNYFHWQAGLIVPALGARVLEVGCGTGNFTRWLLGREAVIAVDIEPGCVSRLRRRFPSHSNLHTEVVGPEDPRFSALRRYNPDSCVCLNVLEHIENDGAALRSMAGVLPAGGVVALLVPAFPALYGPIDRNLRHYRRYTRRSIRDLAAGAGLEIVSLRYMNIVGFFAWWANARIFRRQAQSKAQIALFDRCLAPVLARAEAAIPPPFGQSIVAILRKR